MGIVKMLLCLLVLICGFVTQSHAGISRSNYVETTIINSPVIDTQLQSQAYKESEVKEVVKPSKTFYQLRKVERVKSVQPVRVNYKYATCSCNDNCDCGPNCSCHIASSASSVQYRAGGSTGMRGSYSASSRVSVKQFTR